VLAAFAAAADRLGVQWYLFGAQAALLYGAARLTADADVTVDLGARPTQELVDALAARGFDLRMPDADFIERTRVVPLVHRSTGMPIDVVLAAPGIEELFLARARPRTVDDVTVPVASAEDVLVMKILAGRAKDRDDAAAILAANDGLDLAVVRDTLRLLEQALDQSDLLPELEKLLARRPSR
jgi:hypothetical protein